jgi:hypothetical protein
MVAIQTDPRFVDLKTDVGWARLDSKSGAYLRESAKTDLRKAVIDEGKRSLANDNMEDAQRNAERAIMRLFGPLKNDLREGVSLAIEFK